ncbi:hypothetical protein GCM10009761_02540 [Agromyces terreus]
MTTTPAAAPSAASAALGSASSAAPDATATAVNIAEARRMDGEDGMEALLTRGEGSPSTRPLGAEREVAPR